MSTVITSSSTPCPGKVSKPIYTDHDLIYTIPKLTYDNVNYWKLAMFNYIQGNGLSDFIDVQMIPPPKIIEDAQQSTWIETPIYKRWEEMDTELKMSIISTIHEEVLATIPSSFTEPKGSVESAIHDELLETLPSSFTNPLAEIPGSFKRKSSADLWTYIDKNIHRRPKMTHPDRGDGQKITQHLPLYKAAVEGDVESLRAILKKERTVVRDIITGASETALIIASYKENNNEFVAELVNSMSPDDLAMQNSFGRTAMFGAAATGNVKTLEMMVEKNDNLPNIRDMYNLLPLHFAAYAGQKHSVDYLLKVTKLTYEEATKRLEGSSLITALISGGFYDICLNMLKGCPQLAIAEVSPLETLTNKHSAFLSGAHLSFWQRKIYSYLPSELQCPVDYYKSIGDTENPVEEVVKGTNSRSMFWQLACKYVWQPASKYVLQLACTYVPKIKRIQQKKVMHTQALELLRYICSEIAKCDGKKVRDIIGHPLASAAAMGNAEVVEEILVAFPNALYLLNESKHTVFHIAIANRKASVFNIIYQIRTQRHLMLAQRDASSNTALHLVAYLVDKPDIHSSLDLRSSGPGPALRMQYELQWFKEVKRLSWRQDRELRNKDGKRPATIFAETHAELAKEGEQWMKDRANSRLIIATLIATIVFASAITVPGGSNSNNGIPIFFHRQAFHVFAVSDALALFLSASSMLMSLSILTARYAIKDFLHSLPKRLILALVTLFLSIIFMMVAFTAIIYLVFGDERIWVLGLVSSLASVPVLLFALLQFNPLVDIISSTYGPGIFRKRGSGIRI